MKLPENDKSPAAELAEVERLLLGVVPQGGNALEMALLFDRALRAYELVHPGAGGGRSGRPTKNADASAAKYFGEVTDLDPKYIRKLANLVGKIRAELLLRLRTFRHGVTCLLLTEIARMTPADQEALAARLATAPPNAFASDIVRRWRRERLAGSTAIAEDEVDFMFAFMRGLQRAYGARIFVERRNVGTVVTRDRSGKATGVFNASQVVGAADITGAIAPYGQRFEIEVKADKGRVSDEQHNFRDRMRALGVLHCTVRYDDALDLAANVERAVSAFDSMLGASTAAGVA